MYVLYQFNISHKHWLLQNNWLLIQEGNGWSHYEASHNDSVLIWDVAKGIQETFNGWITPDQVQKLVIEPRTPVIYAFSS